jgi:hypothetical protein
MSEVDVTKIRGLTAEERQEAWDVAAKVVTGNPPRREEFDFQKTARMPAWMQKSIYAGIFIVLAAAFLISAYKINKVGYESFIATFVCYGTEGANCNPTETAGVGAKAAAMSVGIALVLMAEIAQVTFSAGLSTLEEKNNIGRGVLWALIVLSTAIALGGNLELSQPWNKSWWDWIFAVMPPMMVIGAGWLLKEQMMNAIKARREEQLAFEDEYEAWDYIRRNPESAPDWRKVYWNTLKDRLVEANKNLGKAKLHSIPQKAWAKLVYREVRAAKEMETLIEQYQEAEKERPQVEQPDEDEFRIVQKVDAAPLSKPSAQP